MRVVLDTNVLLSACLKPDGLEAQVLNLTLQGQFRACISSEITFEYQEVFLRRKFDKIRERATDILARFESVAFKVTPESRLSIASDDDDNRFLECAEAAGAEYLITGNLRHYPAQHGATRIVNARSFLTMHAEPVVPAALK